MKQVIIPVGKRGTFRPSLGQLPEHNSSIIAWPGPEIYVARKDQAMDMNGLHCPLSEFYAWQYTPDTPVVDNFEAFKQEWEEKNFGFATDYHSYHSDEKMLFIGREVFGNVSNLESAQRISYDHFLSTLNS